MVRKQLNLYISALLYMSTSLLFGWSGPSELVFIPHANMPQRGIFEYGYETQLYKKNSKETLNHGFFYHLALDDKFQLGMRSNEEFDTLFNFKAQFLNFKLSNMHHRVAAGIQNLGWETNQSHNISVPVNSSYAVYSVEIPRLRSSYHLGGMQYKNYKHDVIIAGAHYSFNRFMTMAEWDGRQVHFGLIIYLSKRYNFFMGLSPVPYDGFGEHQQFLTLGFSSKGTLFQDKKELDAIKKSHAELQKKFDILHAKTDVIREFNSQDFLEEFEHFMLKENLVETQLETEKQTSIKLALNHMQRGLEYYYTRDYNRALSEYTKVVAIAPTLAIGHSRLGSIYYKLGQLKEANNSWKKALELNPENTSLKLFLQRTLPLEIPENTEEKSKILTLTKDKNKT